MTGSITIKVEGVYHTRYFDDHGWAAAELVQHLDQLYVEQAVNRAGLVRLLGYTLEMGEKPPRRRCAQWVEIDASRRVLATNSDLIRRAVQQQDPPEDAPYLALSLREIYRVLDALDFSVDLYS